MIVRARPAVSRRVCSPRRGMCGSTGRVWPSGYDAGGGRSSDPARPTSRRRRRRRQAHPERAQRVRPLVGRLGRRLDRRVAPLAPRVEVRLPAVGQRDRREELGDLGALDVREGDEPPLRRVLLRGRLRAQHRRPESRGLDELRKLRRHERVRLRRRLRLRPGRRAAGRGGRRRPGASRRPAGAAVDGTAAARVWRPGVRGVERTIKGTAERSFRLLSGSGSPPPPPPSNAPGGASGDFGAAPRSLSRSAWM